MRVWSKCAEKMAKIANRSEKVVQIDGKFKA